MRYFTLRIIKIIKDTPDVITIYFKQPALKKITYQAGQYLTLIVRINGRKYIRPYSFSSAPNIDSHLEITIKRFPGGVVSNYLYDCARVDDMIEVMEPLGDFVYEPANVDSNLKHVFLWGAGSGITPLMSILKTVLHFSPQKQVGLFYCNRTREQTVFYNEINTLKDSFEENLKRWNFYTGTSEKIYNDSDILGRLKEQDIISIFRSIESYENSIHYICGPESFIETIKSALSQLNIEDGKILTEKFELLIDPGEFDDIETRNVKINQGGDHWEIEVVKGKNILDAALDQLIDLPYSCQTGSCLLCRAKILNGKVKVIGLEKLPDEFLSDDCLLCCGYPYTNDVEIMIN